ncbi:MAG TPA: hypothetical protein VGQ28_10865 [Thermoanaerobaculia bacterium]|jgi:hypothetical protein|nr:hypothetical protein [Thermoanaerobaculia bacterium]
MAKPFFRQGIPAGSTLTILVSTVDGDGFGASAEFEDSSQTTTSFTDAQLKAGASLPLSTPGVYVGQVDVAFAKPATARLHMEVQKPDGSKFVYDEQITRPSNLDRTHIMLLP